MTGRGRRRGQSKKFAIKNENLLTSIKKVSSNNCFYSFLYLADFSVDWIIFIHKEKNVTVRRIIKTGTYNIPEKYEKWNKV